jgi:hypothetical protein
VSGYSIKSLLWEQIPEAAVEAKEDYPNFSQRDLYYVCRNRYLNHPERPYHREYLLKRQPGETDAQYEARREAARQSRAPIDYKYFTTKILRDYERENGKIEGMIREPHGTLVEPHSGTSVELGTLEVADYYFPEHSFDKILYVEKGTERPKFEHDRITITVKIDIVDIGLTVEEAVRIECASEPFSDDDALPHALRPLLTDLELEYFEERKLRFELNGINPPSRRMAYVEERLQAAGIRGKYIPTEDDLEELVASDFESDIASRVASAVDDLVDQRDRHQGDGGSERAVAGLRACRVHPRELRSGPVPFVVGRDR